MQNNNKLNEISENEDFDWNKDFEYRLKNTKWLKYSSNIARRVLAAMDDKEGMTQKKLAEKIGVSPQNVSKILKGDVNLTLRTIATLSTALNVELISFPVYKDEYMSTVYYIQNPQLYTERGTEIADENRYVYPNEINIIPTKQEVYATR